MTGRVANSEIANKTHLLVQRLKDPDLLVRLDSKLAHPRAVAGLLQEGKCLGAHASVTARHQAEAQLELIGRLAEHIAARRLCKRCVFGGRGG